MELGLRSSVEFEGCSLVLSTGSYSEVKGGCAADDPRPAAEGGGDQRFSEVK